jgi:hypothetical protein
MPVPPDNPALAAQLHWHCQLLTFGQRPTPPLLNCCRLLPGQELASQSQNSFDTLRLYLRQLAVAAYQQKAAAVDDIEAGLMQEAQKFFVLTQTDNLWKEHLQVCGVPRGGGAIIRSSSSSSSSDMLSHGLH